MLQIRFFRCLSKLSLSYKMPLQMRFVRCLSQLSLSYKMLQIILEDLQILSVSNAKLMSSLTFILHCRTHHRSFQSTTSISILFHQYTLYRFAAARKLFSFPSLVWNMLIRLFSYRPTYSNITSLKQSGRCVLPSLCRFQLKLSCVSISRLHNQLQEVSTQRFCLHFMPKVGQ